jgi:hypothetical protein
MKINQNGDSAPATSPATLARNTRPVPARARELLSDQQSNGLPVWIRPPRNGGVEFYTGISRSKLYELAGKGRIESRSIREPGQIKGTRLFLLKSVLDFIANCEPVAVNQDANAALQAAGGLN